MNACVRCSIVVFLLAGSGVAGSMLPVASIDSRIPGEPQIQQPAPAVESPSLIRRTVAPPSAEFATYLEGELVRVSIPSNWRELPGADDVTFAPDGAYGNVGAKSVFTHGLRMGLASSDSRDLRIATERFIESAVLAGTRTGRTLRSSRATLGGRAALHSSISSVSEATGVPESIEVYTTMLRDGALLYLLAVAPRASLLDYAPTFQRVLASVVIMDCDPCVPQ